MVSTKKILVVDDEKSMREFLEIMLRGDGYKVEIAESGRDALERIEKKFFDAVISDVKMPDVDGIAVLRKAKETWPDTAVIMITAFASTDTAVEAMKQGALDYITKPFNIEEMRIILQRALERKCLERQNRLLKKELQIGDMRSLLLGKSQAMQQVFDLITKIADTPTNVLITGESGTGKELVAKAIHHESSRREHPFVTIHCGAVPENLIESELFGHVKGAFTGAIQNKVGLFEVADSGTIFLDEIGEVSLPMQVKLLRFIQERTFRRVGSTEDITVNVRIICATNKKLEDEIKERNFREDLYYRLNVIQIHMPPLRQRQEDTELLADHFVKKYAHELNRKIGEISEEAMQVLKNYSYPGNVRELENILERAVALESSSEILPDSLPAEMAVNGGQHHSFSGSNYNPFNLPDEGVSLEELVENIERRLIEQALEKTHGVKKKAAELLKVSFRSFRYRLDKYAMNDRDDMVE